MVRPPSAGDRFPTKSGPKAGSREFADQTARMALGWRRLEKWPRKNNRMPLGWCNCQIGRFRANAGEDNSDGGRLRAAPARSLTQWPPIGNLPSRRGRRRRAVAVFGGAEKKRTKARPAPPRAFAAQGGPIFFLMAQRPPQAIEQPSPLGRLRVCLSKNDETVRTVNHFFGVSKNLVLASNKTATFGKVPKMAEHEPTFSMLEKSGFGFEQNGRFCKSAEND